MVDERLPWSNKLIQSPSAGGSPLNGNKLGEIGMKYAVVFGILAFLCLLMGLSENLFVKIIGWIGFAFFGFTAWMGIIQVRKLSKSSAVFRGRPDLEELSKQQRAGSLGETARWAWSLYSKLKVEESEFASRAFDSRYENAPPNYEEKSNLDRIRSEGRRPINLIELCMLIAEVEMGINQDDAELYDVSKHSVMRELSSLGYIIK